MVRRTHIDKRNAVAASGRGRRFVLIASQFHPDIAESLTRGAVGVLRRAGIAPANIRIIRVPGAFELPVVAAKVARSRRRPHAVIVLGAVIRGDTPQYAVIAHAAANSLSHVAVATGVPVTFGVIVAETLAQARARAKGSRRHRGKEAARAALEVLRALETL